MKVRAEVADSPASFQPLNAHTSAGARSPSGRRSQRSGCIRSTVPRPRVGHYGRMSSPPSAVTIAGLRAGDDGRRRLRVHAQGPPDRAHGHALPGARAARPDRARSRRARSATPTCSPAASSAATSSASPAASSASATSCRSRSARSRAPSRRIRRRSCPSPTATVDELDGFLEHLAREVHDPAYRALLERLLGDDGAARAVAARALHARRPPRLPRRPARAHGRGRDARARDARSCTRV